MTKRDKIGLMLAELGIYFITLVLVFAIVLLLGYFIFPNCGINAC